MNKLVGSVVDPEAWRPSQPNAKAIWLEHWTSIPALKA
jgi:hypothetical protein